MRVLITVWLVAFLLAGCSWFSWPVSSDPNEVFWLFRQQIEHSPLGRFAQHTDHVGQQTIDIMAQWRWADMFLSISMSLSWLVSPERSDYLFDGMIDYRDRLEDQIIAGTWRAQFVFSGKDTFIKLRQFDLFMGEGNMQAKLLEAMYSRAIDQWLVVYGEDFGLVGKDNVSRLPSWQQMSLVPQQNNTFVMQYNDQSSQTWRQFPQWAELILNYFGIWFDQDSIKQSLAQGRMLVKAQSDGVTIDIDNFMLNKDLILTGSIVPKKGNLTLIDDISHRRIQFQRQGDDRQGTFTLREIQTDDIGASMEFDGRYWQEGGQTVINGTLTLQRYLDGLNAKPTQFVITPTIRFGSQVKSSFQPLWTVSGVQMLDQFVDSLADQDLLK